MKRSSGNVLVVIVALLALLAIGIVGFSYWKNSNQIKTPLTWENCIKDSKAIIQLTYPSICRLPSGKSITQPLTDVEKKNVQPPDETATWFNINDTYYGFEFKAPPGWGREKNMMTGEFEAFTKNTIISENQSLILIMPSKDSKESIAVDFNRPIVQRVSKNGTNPLLDEIISTFRFLDQSSEGTFCGGIAGVKCPSSYVCQLDGNYPDAGGKCIKN